MNFEKVIGFTRICSLNDSSFFLSMDNNFTYGLEMELPGAVSADTGQKLRIAYFAR